MKPHLSTLVKWCWTPVGILAFGLLAVLWLSTHPPRPLPFDVGPPPVLAAVRTPELTSSPARFTGRAEVPVQIAWHDETFALIEAFRQAYEREDLEALMALFGPDPRENDVIGREAVEGLYTRNFAVLEGIEYDLTDLQIERGFGTAGDITVQGRFRIRATELRPPPRSFDIAGRIRWTLRHERGALRIVGIDY